MASSRKIPNQSRSSRAKLIFPVGRIHKLLSRGVYAKRVGVSAAIALATALEYVINRVIDESIKVMHHDKRSRITTRHILYAIENDENMKELFNHFVLTSAGDIQKVETKDAYLFTHNGGGIPILPSRPTTSYKKKHVSTSSAISTRRSKKKQVSTRDVSDEEEQ